MKLQLLKGSTSVRLMVFVADSGSTTGAGLTGLSSGSSGLKWYYWRGDTGNSGGTAVSLAGGTRGTWTSGGIVEIDSTNMPGWYELGVPNASLATGSNSVVMHLMGVTNMAPLPLEIQLVGFDPNNGTSLGLSNLDAAISSRLASASYTAPSIPPTVEAIRAEMDANSTKLAHLDADVSSRLSAGSYTAPSVPPSVEAIRSEMDANSTKLARLDVSVSTRLAAGSYTSPSVPPTVEAIRTELDANSTKLAHLDADVSSRLSSAGYTAPDNGGIAAIQERTDRLPDDPAGAGSVMTLAAGSISEESFSLPETGTGPAEGFLGRMEQVWRYFFKKATLGGGLLKTYGDDGTSVLTTQVVSDNGQTQTRGEAA